MKTEPARSARIKTTLHDALAEHIAAATQTSVESVRSVYEQEVLELAETATITQFIDVIATHRVWLRLRRN